MSAPSVEQLRQSAVVDFAHALVSAVLNRLLHARDSRFVAASLGELVAALQRAAELGVEMPLQLQLDETRVCHDGVPLDGPSLQARSLLEHCGERGIGMLAFDRRLDPGEANRLLDLLLLPENRRALDRNHRDATLLACGVRNVHVTLRQPADPTDRRVGLDEHGLALRRYQDLAATLQHNHRLAHRDLELDVDETSTAIERAVADVEEPSLLLSLSMQDDVDRFTVGHSVRVALLALQVARAVGADRDQLVRIGAAALMHDIGKSKVPQDILFKRGRLTQEEWGWMAQHPRLGAQILIEQHHYVDPTAIGAAFCHHMGADGSGYPEAMLPVSPSATSRLIRVCDVFEALTAVRPYKHALTPTEAYAVMFRNPNDFDQRWLQRFVRTLGLFPIGTRVELRSGAHAIVRAQTDDIARPALQMLSGPDGEPLPADHPERVRVGDALDGEPVQIGRIHSHDRVVAMPELDPDDPDGCGATVHDACLHVHTEPGPHRGHDPRP